MNCLKCQLQIEPPSTDYYGLHKACFIGCFNVSGNAEFVSLQRKSTSSSDPANNQSPQDNSFFFTVNLKSIPRI